MIRTAIRTLPIRSIQPERTCPFPERLFRAAFTERLVTRRASVGSASFPGPANAGRPVRKSRSFFATSWSLISLAADQTLAWFQHQGGDRAAAPAIQKTPPCFWEVHVPDLAVGEHDRAPALEARRRGRRTTLHFVSIRHSAWPSQITGRRRERSKMCDGRRHGRSAGGEARPHLGSMV